MKYGNTYRKGIQNQRILKSIYAVFLRKYSFNMERFMTLWTRQEILPPMQFRLRSLLLSAAYLVPYLHGFLQTHVATGHLVYQYNLRGLKVQSLN